MATSHTRWAVVMSRNAGFVDQCVELDFQYPSEGIHRRWDGGFRITACASTPDQAAFVLSVPRRRPVDETQETLRTSAFPSTHLMDMYDCCLLGGGLTILYVNVLRTSGQRICTLQGWPMAALRDRIRVFAHDDVLIGLHGISLPGKCSRPRTSCVQSHTKALFFRHPHGQIISVNIISQNCIIVFKMAARQLLRCAFQVDELFRLAYW
eukprot:scaffold243078_cov31-Prasinocladus_malaysianus.AAC.1